MTEPKSFVEIFDYRSEIDPVTLRTLVESNPLIVLYRDASGDSLLHWVTHHGSNGLVGMVALLIDAGADVNAQGYSKETPLHRLIDYAHPGAIEAARLLLQHGARLEILDANEQTPLERAILKQNRPFMSFYSARTKLKGDEAEQSREGE